MDDRIPDRNDDDLVLTEVDQSDGRDTETETEQKKQKMKRTSG